MEAAASLGSRPPTPTHVAIIMDGNGRWAKARSLPRFAGHRQGAQVARKTITYCQELGISYLTLFAFSSENWKRPLAEIDDLMGLLRIYLERELSALVRNGVRLRFIGDRQRLPRDIITLLDESEQRTQDSGGLTLTLALNYGGRDEIVNAARRLAQQVADGELDPAAIDEAHFTRHLHTVDIPDPDLLIRTSGEQRISNFLLWQCAYTELVFSPVMWPDFDKNHLEDAINEFHQRERRYGATSE